MADEFARRVVHASGTGLPALAVFGLVGWDVVRWLFVAGALVALVLEFCRLFVGLDWAVYDRLTREYEQDNLAGYALYFISSAGIALLFSRPIAIPAILMLTVGDPVSGLLGSDEMRTAKRAYVLLAMFGVCALVAAPFVGTVPALLGATAATVADGVKPVIAGYVIDDNLTIPPAAAVGIIVGREAVTLLG